MKIHVIETSRPLGGGGGGGTVISVNGKGGPEVVLDADDIDDAGRAHRFATAAELAKLGGIEAGADVTDAAGVAAAGAVMTSGDQGIAGVKTFSSSPMVPTPSASGAAASKAYADTKATPDIILPPWRAGRYYGPGSHGMGDGWGGNQTLSPNWHTAVPVYVPRTVTIDRIGVYVSSAGAGGTTIRLSIYAMGSDGLPSALVLDAGTVSGATTGAKEIVVSQSLAGGRWYHLCCAANGLLGVYCCYPMGSFLGASAIPTDRPEGFACYVDRGDTAAPAAFGTPTGYDPVGVAGPNIVVRAA